MDRHYGTQWDYVADSLGHAESPRLTIQMDFLATAPTIEALESAPDARRRLVAAGKTMEFLAAIVWFSTQHYITQIDTTGWCRPFLLSIARFQTTSGQCLKQVEGGVIRPHPGPGDTHLTRPLKVVTSVQWQCPPL